MNLKRFALLFAIIGLVVAFSGCSIVANVLRRVVPHPTPAAALVTTIEATPDGSEASPSSDAAATEPADATPTAAEQTEADTTETPAPAVSQYTSTGLGIAFTVPNSWFGKYRVEEGDGYLTVYFKPAQPIDPDVGDGELFCIVKKTPDIDTSMYDNAQEFTVNGVDYMWGQPTDVRYSEGQPEYDTYVQMQNDFAAIFQSIRAAE